MHTSTQTHTRTLTFTRVSIIVQYKSRPVTRATVAAQCVDTLLSAVIGGGQPALVVVCRNRVKISAALCYTCSS